MNFKWRKRISDCLLYLKVNESRNDVISQKRLNSLNVSNNDQDVIDGIKFYIQKSILEMKSNIEKGYSKLYDIEIVLLIIKNSKK